MPIPLEIIAKLLSPLIVALIIGVTKRIFEQRPRLITYLVHASAIPLPDVSPATGQIPHVNTHSIVVRNTGKKTAHNVRIGHYQLPSSYQIWPPVSYEVVKAPTPNIAAEIIIPTLVPDEQVSISYLYLPPVLFTQINSYAKSDECMAKIIDVIPSPRPHKAVVFLLWVLIFVGASTLVYWLFFIVAGWLIK